jgi:hypothetical protein
MGIDFNYSKEKTYIAIFSNNREKKLLDADELSIFHYESGAEIPCKGCAPGERKRLAPGIGDWFYGEDLVLTREVSVGDSTKFILQKAVVGEKDFDIVDFQEFSERSSVKTYAITINEMGDLQARKCAETCWLWTRNLSTGEEKEYHSKCEGGFLLEWKNGVPDLRC